MKSIEEIALEKYGTKVLGNLTEAQVITVRDAYAGQFGLSWDEYTKLTPEARKQLGLVASGYDFNAGVDTMARVLRLEKLKSYFNGMNGAGRIVLIAAAAGAVWLFLPQLKALPKQVRKAVS
ncbi:MAG: hypothetical protein WC959_07530 [Kiritimatiellales bacterium]